MDRILILLIFILSTRNALALNCYVTEFETVSKFNTTAIITEEDCKTYMGETLQERNISVSWFRWYNSLRCYTIGIRAKFQNQNETTDYDIRQCNFKNHCDDYVEDINLEMMGSSMMGVIKCTECDGNLCNMQITNDLVKTHSDTSSYRRNLYIGAGGCGVVGVLGALTRCLFCRKSKNIRTVNV